MLASRHALVVGSPEFGDRLISPAVHAACVKHSARNVPAQAAKQRQAPELNGALECRQKKARCNGGHESLEEKGRRRT